MRLLLTLILGFGFAYTLSYDAPDASAKAREGAAAQNSIILSALDYPEKTDAAEASPESPEFKVVPSIETAVSYEHGNSESWWESRFSYLGDK